MFESSVNSEGIETQLNQQAKQLMFESSVNSEGIETYCYDIKLNSGLRAV